MIIRFAGFGGQGIVLILRVIAGYGRKITRPINTRPRPRRRRGDSLLDFSPGWQKPLGNYGNRTSGEIKKETKT